jgi:hypothetical protein
MEKFEKVKEPWKYYKEQRIKESWFYSQSRWNIIQILLWQDCIIGRSLKY